jgi:hypothetical protein
MLVFVFCIGIDYRESNKDCTSPIWTVYSPEEHLRVVTNVQVNPARIEFHTPPLFVATRLSLLYLVVFFTHSAPVTELKVC